ncbi:MAG: hypothetical protein K8T91_05295 [Planctomycetes bacterium]|nr:hypothetical protein [Planctomycetota bacterium]
MLKTRLTATLVAFLLATLYPAFAWSVDAEAVRRQQEQQRQQRLEQERNNLDNQIRSGQRQLEQARQQEQQIRKALPNLEKQYQEAMQQAEKFKPQLESQQQEADKARALQKAASDKVREARKQLTEIGDHLEKVQPSDAPIAQARVRYDKAQVQYDQVLKRILESAEYKQAFQAALDTGDKEKASDVRNSFVKGNVELSALQLELKTSRQAYEDLRKSLIEGHPDHQRVSEAVKSAQAELTEAGKQLDDAVKKNGQAKAVMANKVGVARKASTVGKQAQANVQRLDQAQKNISQQIQRLQDRRNNLR